MSTVTTFSEKERQYQQYQARQEYLLEQPTILRELLQTKLRDELALKEKQSAVLEKEAALAEIERLKALLANRPVISGTNHRD